MNMDTFRKGLAGVCAALFILSAIASLLLYNLEQKAFSIETYQQAFANENFYERLPAMMAQAFMASVDQPGMPVALRSMSEQQWEGFLRELLPPEALKAMGDQALTSTFAYLNGQSNAATVDLTVLKSQMASSAGTQAVMNLMQTLPPCTLEELTRITMALLNNQEIAFCNPPAEFQGIVQPIIQGQVQVAAAAVPSTLTLASYDAASGQPDPRQQIQTMRLFMRLSPILPLGFFFLMTVLAVRGLRDWLLWWGIPFMVIGLSVSIMVWTGAPLVGWVLFKLLTGSASFILPAVLGNDISQLASAIVEQALRPLSFQALVIMGVGFVMTVSAVLIHAYMQSTARQMNRNGFRK
jgi:hypothetical protein